jgi:hypothetical protein
MTTDVTTTRNARSRPGIDVHRVKNLHPDDRTIRQAIPTTTVARTLLDLAEVVRPTELQKAFDEAERHRLLDRSSFDALFDPRRRLPCPGRLSRHGAEPAGAENVRGRQGARDEVVRGDVWGGDEGRRRPGRAAGPRGRPGCPWGRR